LLSPETRDKIATAAAARDERAFKAAVSAFKKDENAYVDLVSKRLRPADVVPANAALTTPLNAAQAEQVRALLAKSLPPREMTALKATGLLLQQIGAFLGIMMFSVCATRLGRRPAFLFSFLIAWFSVAFVFINFDQRDEVWYMFPLLGFGTLAPFGGYALYFPELFPTRLRTTGTGFCYNTGRYASALGPAALGYLGASLHGKFDVAGFRLAAASVSCAYLIGIVALIWAPETMDQPLPEDEKILAH
jgi:MFS family permease